MFFRKSTVKRLARFVLLLSLLSFSGCASEKENRNKMSENMSALMDMLARDPDLCKKYYARVKKEGLFPLKYSREYTVKNEKPEDPFLKKCRKRISALSYTRIGFGLLRVLYGSHLLS
ncbi:MAG: hypothetical protein IJK02_12170 [Clostridia bacterium]|nr:hypothetical protein [Clostridia bacterium]